MRKCLLLVLCLVFSDLAIGQKINLGNGLYWEFYDGMLIISGEGEMPHLYDYPWEQLLIDGKITKIIVKEGVKTISRAAFYNRDLNYALKEVYLPSTLHTIGKRSFMFNKGLYKVVFGSGLKIIGSQAFSVCNSLTDITIPEGVEIIEEYAFERSENPIKKVRIPLGIKSIGYQAFALTDNNISQFYECEVELLPNWLTLDQCKIIGLSEKSYKSYLAKKEGSNSAGSTNNDRFWFFQCLSIEYDSNQQPIKDSAKYLYPDYKDCAYEIQFCYASNYQTAEYPITIYLNEIGKKNRRVSYKEIGKVKRANKSSVEYSKEGVNIFVEGYKIAVISDGSIYLIKTENTIYKNCLIFYPVDFNVPIYEIRYSVLVDKLKSIKWGD